MQIGNTTRGWGAVQQGLHWLTVLLVLIQVWLGFSFAAAVPENAHAGTYIAWHIATGATIFVVTAVRLFWRSRHPVPTLPDDLTATQKSLSLVTHRGLYGVLLVQPITGYFTWAGRAGFFPFEEPSRFGVFSVIHALGVALLVMFASLHIMAALRHELVLRDNVLRRMTPLARRPDAADRNPPPGPEVP